MVEKFIVLTNGHDKFFGQSFDEHIFGLKGNDEIQSVGGYDILDGGDGNDWLWGGDEDDFLYGGNGNDRLQGEHGADVLNGGPGVDWADYNRSIAGVMVDLLNNVTGGLGAAKGDKLYGIENLYGTNRTDAFYGTNGKNWFMGEGGSDYLNGRGGNDILWGASGNDTIVGGTGNDVMMGGEGNDTYEVNWAGDTVWEVAGEGEDTVRSFVHFSIKNYPALENVRLLAFDNLNATGNALDNDLYGNLGINKLTGGKGNDRYIVQDGGDSVVELSAGGGDTVISSVNYKLPANVENLTLTGSDPLFGFGNELNNRIAGNTGNNILIGKEGSDRYIVQDAADQVVDSAGSHDIIESSVTYTLPSSIEELELTGNANINGFGHGGASILRDNSGKNMLVGKGGDDIYFIGAGDRVVEAANAGYDQVHSRVSFTLPANVEWLSLEGYSNYQNGAGNALDNTINGSDYINRLDGHDGDDWLRGEGGNDKLAGGAGADTMWGGQGSDTYFYGGPSQSSPDAPDTIKDFGDLGQDRIDLSSFFPGTFVGTAAFTGIDQVRINDVVGPNIRIEVNLTGNLVAEMVIILANTTAAEITAADFVL